MDPNTKLDCQRIGRTFNLAPELADKIATLLASGLSPLTLAYRHRHELPGVGDWQIFGVKRSISEEHTLTRRRQSLLSHLQTANRLTPEVEAKVAAARTTHAVDLLQAVWKRRRSSPPLGPHADKLHELADQVLAGTLDAAGLETALSELESAASASPSPTTPAEPEGDASTTTPADPTTDDIAAADAPATDAAAGDAVPDDTAAPAEPSTAPPTSTEGAAPDPSSSAPARGDSLAVRAAFREVIKDRIRHHTELYECISKLLRSRGKVTCRTILSSADEPSPETKAEATEPEAAGPFAQGVLPKESVPAPTTETEAEAVQVVDALATEKKVDAADIRRRRRKESRRRRRAHLESTFKDFMNVKMPVNKVMPWQYLMMDHADRLRILELVIEAPAAGALKGEAEKALQLKASQHECVSACLDEVLLHDILPELKRLLRKELSSRAQSHAAKYATSRIRELLQAPAHRVPVMAIDITGKHDAEVAVLDREGEVLVTQSTNLGESASQRSAAVDELKRLIEAHQVELIAIGEGSRGRAMESVLASLVAEFPNLGYAMVNREGTEQYATSPLGSRELPQHAAKSRAAISLARRLQDPLAELGKIDPRHLVATSWPIIPDESMNERLHDSVAACAGRLGVDVNRANEVLLGHVPGLNEELAGKLIADRRSHGPFKSKEDVRRVDGLSDEAWAQAVGFLRVVGDNPLDHSLLIPDQFPQAEAILAKAELTSAALAAAAPEPHSSTAIQALGKLDAEGLATELGQTPAEIKMLIATLKASILARREASKDYAIQSGSLTFEELKPDDELLGTVSKVVSFGVFVDLGCGLTGLCHVSQMGSNIRDAREQFAVGDLKRVEIVSLDTEQRHIALRLAGTQSTHGAPKREGRGRRPAHKNKKERGHGKPRGPRKPIEVTARAKGKKAPPITDAMKEGNEPMRTFGDLKQFFEQDDSPQED